MKLRVLFIVTSDPRASARPAEAVRIAAGVGVWQRAEVAVYLRGEAALALGESAEDLLDGESFGRHWPILVEAGQAVYAQKDAAALHRLESNYVAFSEITDPQLAELTAVQTYVIRF